MMLLLQVSILEFFAASVAAVSCSQCFSRSDEGNSDTPLPLIIWHGLGDSYGNEGLQSVAALAEAVNPGTLVHIVKNGANPDADQRATFLADVNAQIDQLCNDTIAHPILSTAPALDAIGFSQGGLFLRGFVERCSGAPPVRSLVTFGSPHNGISKFSECAPTSWLCRGAMALLRGNVWGDYVQRNLVPAQYYRPPEQYEQYLEHSKFLADVNNERQEKRLKYKENMPKLENFVMFLFEEDQTVIPKESCWFSEVNGTVITPLRARQIYKEDWIGLKALDRRGGLHFRSIPGKHMQLEDGLLNNTFLEFLGPLKKSRQTVPMDDL